MDHSNLTDLMCVCPCHDPEHPLKTPHDTPCCCPHRHVVPSDCEECSKPQADDPLAIQKTIVSKAKRNRAA